MKRLDANFLTSWFGALCLLAITCRVHASELPYAADGLPHLAQDADIVFECSEATIVAQPDDSATFVVKARPKKTLKGDTLPAEVTLMASRSLGNIDVNMFTNSMVFARGPLDSGQRAFWHLPEGEETYQLVSGAHSVVPLNPLRRAQIEIYVSVHDAAAGSDVSLGWAVSQLNSHTSDPFLQRSAVYELERHPEDDRAIAALGHAAELHMITTEVRALAVRVLGDSRAPTAIKTLRGVASNPGLLPVVRTSAIQKLVDRPEGREVVQSWIKASDKLLSREARRVLGLKQN